MLGELDEKVFRDALDEDVDLAIATESASRVETHRRRNSASQNFPRTQCHFVFDAAGAKRAHCASIFANQHSRAWPPITRAFSTHQRCQGERFAPALLELSKDV